MLEAIKIRRSIRTYINKKVKEEKIEEIIRAAMQAPSSKGACPWEFVVVDDNEVLEKLSKCQHRARHIKYANICIVVLGNKDKFIKPDYNGYGLVEDNSPYLIHNFGIDGFIKKLR